MGWLRIYPLPNRGERFGRWVVVSNPERNSRGQHRIPVRCDCGYERSVMFADLRTGKSRSCGCDRAEVAARRFRKHGKAGSRLYQIWGGILTRCYNPRATHFEHYGGRGISVDPSWRADYLAFEIWALANGYSDELEIDRRDVNGNYVADNCRWVTHAVNVANRRSRKRAT